MRGCVIICQLQMCGDFPCGIVNVNRISMGVITFPQAAQETQACGDSVEFESVEGRPGPSGRDGGVIRRCTGHWRRQTHPSVR